MTEKSRVATERKAHFAIWGRWLMGLSAVPVIFGLAALALNYPTSNGPNGLCYVYLSSICTYSGTVTAGSFASYIPYIVIVFIGVVMILSGVVSVIRSGLSPFRQPKTKRQENST